MKGRQASGGSAGPFISYAREDQALVRQLHEALARRGREAWVDWQGILPTEAWLRKIHDAIDAASAFVFVISPDSAASRVCNEEIDHAVAQRKRLIPVLHREVEGGTLHPEVARLNWVPLREGESFDADVDALIEAMDLDLEWIRHHTRLLVRGNEWAQRGKDASLLLRGRDLQEAQAWLGQAGASASRVATATQTAFIAASSQDSVRRQRRNLMVLATGLLVAVGLALLAWQQRNAARVQRDLANSRLLASQSAALRDRHLDLALLLAAEAQRIAPTAQARTSLLQAAQLRPRLLRYLAGHPARVDRLMFARGGTLLAAGDRDFNTSLFESDSGRRLLWIQGTPGDTSALALSRDGRWLARGRGDGSVALHDTHSGTATTLRAAGGPVHALALSEDGELLATGGEDGTVTLLSRAAGTVQCRFAPTPGGAVTGLWLAGGEHLVSRHGWNTWRWSARDCGAGARALPDPHTATVVLDWIGGRLFGTEPGPPNLTVVDLAGKGVLEQQPDYRDYALALAPLGSMVAIGSRDGDISFWDTHRRAPARARLTGHASAIHALAVDDQGTRLASGALDGDILLWDVAAAAAQSTPDTLLRAAGSTFWRLDAGGRLSTLAGDHRRDLGRPALDFAVSPDGRRLAVLLDRGEIRVLDPATAAAPRGFAAARAWQAGLALHPHEPLLVFADGRDVIVWHTGRGVQVTRLVGHGGDITALTFSPGGELLASAGADNAIRLWNTSRWDPRAHWPQASERYVRSLAFDASGRRLAAGGGMEDGTVTVWDVATGRRLFAPLRSEEVDVTQVAFDARGELLAAASFTGGTSVWDLGTLQRVAQLPSSPTRPESGAVMAFGLDALTVTSRQGPQSWPLDLAHWRQRACRLANRDLTPEEWSRHLPDYPYRATCPGD